jgi:branched-chain amino acid transport system ATP-binding protein
MPELPVTSPLLRVDDLHAYYGESHVLKGVDLYINPGEVVTLLGRNGAGKTTTLKAIMGILRPRSGVVEYAGRDVAGLLPEQIARAGIAYPSFFRAISPPSWARYLPVPCARA